MSSSLISIMEAQASMQAGNPGPSRIMSRYWLHLLNGVACACDIGDAGVS